MTQENNIKRGEIYFVDFGKDGIGSEQKGKRPALIIQNDTGNLHSPTVIVAPITSSFSKNHLPTHVHLGSGAGGLSKNSIVLMEQIKTIDKSRLMWYVGFLDNSNMKLVDNAVAVSIGIPVKKTA